MKEFVLKLSVFILVCLLYSCNQSKSKDILELVDIESSSSIYLSHQSLCKAFANQNISNILELRQNAPQFSEIFLHEVMNFPENVDTSIYNQFLAHPSLQKNAELVCNRFGTLDTSEIHQVLQRFHYYFPEAPAHKIYTHFSEYGYKSFVFQDDEKSGISLGLDFYLDDDFNYNVLARENPIFSQYINWTFQPIFLAQDLSEILITPYFENQIPSNFLEDIIIQGKKHYVLSLLNPDHSEDLILKQPTEKWSWLQNNEGEIWSFYLEHELLYESSMVEYKKYINPAPSSSGMPKESPGKTGIFVGYQIVKSFISRHPDTSIQKLLEMDPTEIFEKSRYRPKK